MNSFVEQGVSPDEQLNALANSDRRRLLFALLDGRRSEEGPIEIVEWVNGDGPSDSLTAMQHTHLPKLDDAGVIRWGRHTGRVERGPKFAEIEPLLRLVYENRTDLPHEWA